MPDHERRRSFRPRCESLGDRILPAAGPTAQVIQGVLFVSGTESADVIDVSITPYRTPRGAIPVVQVAGVRRLFPATRFNMVVVDARGGDDTVRINDRGRPLLSTWLDGGDGNDTLIGSSAPDRIIGGLGDDVIVGRGGADAIDGGPGLNIINGVATPAPAPPAPPEAQPAPPPAPSTPPADPISLPTTSPSTPQVVAPSPTTRPEAVAPVALNAAEQVLVDRTNQARAEAGLAPLTVNAQLQEAAKIQADNMARLNRIAHDLPETSTPTLGDRARAAGYRYAMLGENLAYNYYTPSQAIDGWLGSEGHRRNILTADYTQIGIAIAHNAAGQPYYVQVFGRPIA